MPNVNPAGLEREAVILGYKAGSMKYRTGGISHWRDCHFVDALSPSLLKHLLKVEGVAAE